MPDSIIAPTNAEIDVISRERDLPPTRLVDESRKPRPERPKDHNGRIIGNPNHSGFIGWHKIPRGRRKGEWQKLQFMILNAADIDPKEAEELIQVTNKDHYGSNLEVDHIENVTSVQSSPLMKQAESVVGTPDKVQEVPNRIEPDTVLNSPTPAPETL